ncbi:MAG: DUF4301 family protein [Bacteroides sp.]|nr:DUF4301 family protein [Bacteroides sp.]MDD4720575.1 DUF4301 family protein [Bacteroides sp.]NLI63951.1 DUF4301 family protein [Bacteroidales bacterium]
MTGKENEVLKSKGISIEEFNKQLKRFKEGFPYLKLHSEANTHYGIVSLNNHQEEEYLAVWEDYITGPYTIMKFVPASGAASRMFKDLYGFLSANYSTPTTSFEKMFFNKIQEFAFFDDLDEICRKSKKTKERGVLELIENKEYKTIIELLLLDSGLNYGSLPKGLLKFHSYKESARTPFEEHLVEGAKYAATKSGVVNVHFTVSSEHKDLFQNLLKNVESVYESTLGVRYSITFSEQKPSTDTIAVDMDNSPFRDEEGNLVFRPGGHGALIENLNDLNADVIFIKNIDNVVPDHLKAETIKYKQILAGVLVSVQSKIFNYLRLLDSGRYSHDQVLEILQFVQKTLCCKNPETKYLEDSVLVLYLKEKLNRPLRVCGMVENVGEPGGGPFLAYNSDGTISPQILESSQIDSNNNEYLEMFRRGTHFNPVDLVCGVRDYNGGKFNLKNYIDKNTGFISKKSMNGKELKALERPGLWNGAMSDWNTVFVEVPLATFNPVKTVNDLLRDSHQ